jgi:L-amino acid N-acyltransferase YncA
VNPSGHQIRPATPGDAEAIARIYTEGIEDRIATFETEPRTAADVQRWFEPEGPLLTLVVESEDRVIAWASATAYRPDRVVYSGVAEFSVYVAREARGRGAGRSALDALIREAEAPGLWKLLGRIFPENVASLALCRSLGFREVGVYRRHGRLDGEWRDCVIVERLLGPATPPIEIQGERLRLRPLRPAEIDQEWEAMRTADAMTIASLTEEVSFRRRLERSGRLESGWLDLAIDLDGESIGRIQTFVPPGRTLPPGVYEVGIGLREATRGRGYGREALRLLTDWLFEHAGAERVEAPTDPLNVAMRTVFDRVGWELVGTLNEFDREWVMYAITRVRWEAGRRGSDQPHPG